ncbi:uncharacterized protein TM35_000222420 [Trypanosoma theileri]|uniref:Uncharacterized protein n=1 Tax=Trypanosoma theileri TaxID=67003 RepID=A0A1X0NSJ0_9TRYP|nr:uncharacterized protein TM35_000222420 [Trypanosoma theileri]ORC87443.1 hypothetical protein TM35_000222420 [Trypanosoma theileri]
MITQKLREMLERPIARRQRPDIRTPQTVVVGKRMTVNGCASIVCLTGQRAEERHQRHAVLQGIGPGDVIRTPARYFDSIVEERRLPKSQHCRMWRRRPAGEATWGPTRVVPCSHHNKVRMCTRCPWMGLAVTASRDIKAERLRRAVETSIALDSTSYSIASTSGGGETVNTNGDDNTFLTDEKKKRGKRTWPPSSVRFLEPFDISVDAHTMREMEFHFEQASQRESTGSVNQTEGNKIETAGKFCFSMDSKTAPDCFLCTLEQQRLLASLNRWAEQLAFPIQQTLCSVFVLQHPRNPSAHTWERDLHVTLLLRQDVSRFGGYTPLCGPSQAENTLSLEEQKLVDAVLSAAPLTQNIGVATLCTDGSLSCLYPQPQRVDLSLARSTVEKEVVPCTAVHGFSGEVRKAVLPFMHSTVAFALSSQDISVLEHSSPSLWRQGQALEAVGSLLLSLLGDKQSDSSLVIFADHNYEDPLGASVAQRSGSQLLALILTQLFEEHFSQSVLHVVKRKREGEKKGLVDLLHLSAVMSTLRAEPSLWVCLIDSNSDVAAATSFFRQGIEFIRQKSILTPKKFLLIQLTGSGNFDLLSQALCGVRTVLEGHGQLHLESGIVDIDPWTAAAVGYVVLEFTI